MVVTYTPQPCLWCSQRAALIFSVLHWSLFRMYIPQCNEEHGLVNTLLIWLPVGREGNISLTLQRAEDPKLQQSSHCWLKQAGECCEETKYKTLLEILYTRTQCSSNAGLLFYMETNGKGYSNSDRRRFKTTIGLSFGNRNLYVYVNIFNAPVTSCGPQTHCKQNRPMLFLQHIRIALVCINRSL